MTCEEFRELAGAFALGAVTPQETLEAREHLQSCADCTRYWQELRATVDFLSMAAEEVSPRAEVKKHILAQVRNEPRQSIVTPRPVGMESLPTPRKRKYDAGRIWLAAAALFLLCLCVGLSVWNVGLQGQVTSRGQQLTVAAQQNSVLQQQAREVPLTFSIQGLKDMAGASGKLLYIPRENLTVVIIQGLPKPQGSAVYQGWLIQNKKPTSMGLLFLQNGTASLTYHGSIANFDVAAISLEPGPAASLNAPVGPVIATGQLMPAKP